MLWSLSADLMLVWLWRLMRDWWLIVGLYFLLVLRHLKGVNLNGLWCRLRILCLFLRVILVILVVVWLSILVDLDLCGL